MVNKMGVVNKTGVVNKMGVVNIMGVSLLVPQYYQLLFLHFLSFLPRVVERIIQLFPSLMATLLQQIHYTLDQLCQFL